MNNDSVINLLANAYSIVNTNSFNLICDVERRIKFAGRKILDFCNLTNEDVIGKKLSEISSFVRPLSTTYTKLNTELINGRVSELSYISIINNLDELAIIKSTVNLIKIENIVIGLHVSIEIPEPFSWVGISLAFNLINMDQERKILTSVLHLPNTTHSDYKLNELQELTLFLVIIGRSDKEVALIISQLIQDYYSQHAVSKILTRHLFPLFNVGNRRELIKKTLQLNVIQRIPKMFFKDNESLLLILNNMPKNIIH